MLGRHCLTHWSSTQGTIALSSGEAELAGIAKGATHALGFCSMSKDLDLPFTISLYSDAIAAIGIARRRGIGRVRHLSTTDLWVQEKVRTGEISLVKIDGKINPADIFTKYEPRPLLDKHLITMSL